MHINPMYRHNESQQTGVGTKETQGQFPRRQKSSAGAYWLLALLAAAVAGIASYGYLRLEKCGFQLSQLPGLQESLTAARQRLDATESQLRAWAGNWDTFNERIRKVEGKINQNLQLARQHAAGVTEELHKQMQAEMDTRTHVLEAQLRHLESNQAADHARLAQIQSEIAALRQNTDQELATLHQRAGRNEGNLETITQKLERQRVDFEVAKNRTAELVPGITLRVTSTDVSYQRFGGWLWLLPHRRTLWIRQRGVQQPLVFYHKPGSGAAELVVTDVAKDFVIGYLLLPVQESAAASASAQGVAEATSPEIAARQLRR